MADETRSILVFGGSGAVGTALARRLIGAGCEVTIASRDAERLAISAAETGAATLVCDARDGAAVAEAVSATLDRTGRLDGIASCVGSLLLKPAHLTTDEEWDETLATNLTSAFHVVRHGAKAMMRTGGTIVLTSSAAATVGLANHEAIGAAKAGVEGLVRSAAASYGPRGIRVNAVAPGLVDSALTARITAHEGSLEASRKMHVLGKIGDGDDVAAAMAWLLDADGAWVTGSIVNVDGGLASVRSRS